MQGNIITPGLTIASENPVYIQGNYNATAGQRRDRARTSATAIIADSVTLLSNAWNDIRSFTSPNDSADRDAATTGYRVAIVSGKGLAFPKPALRGRELRVRRRRAQLPARTSKTGTARRDAAVPRIARQLLHQPAGDRDVQVLQGDAYTRGPREWTFDSDFLTPSLLPPGTPMFRDVNTLTFRQLLRPTQ